MKGAKYKESVPTRQVCTKPLQTVITGSYPVVSVLSHWFVTVTRVPLPLCVSNGRLTEATMARRAKGEGGAVEAWLDTSITHLHALVGQIQVQLEFLNVPCVTYTRHNTLILLLMAYALSTTTCLLVAVKHSTKHHECQTTVTIAATRYQSFNAGSINPSAAKAGCRPGHSGGA